MNPSIQSLFDQTLYEGPGYIKGGRVQPILFKDGVTFCYCTGGPNEHIFYKTDPVQNTKVPFLDNGRLRGMLEQALGHALPGAGLPFDAFEFANDEKAIRFIVEDKVFLLQLEDYAISSEPLPPPPTAEDLARRTPRMFPWLVGESVPEELSPDGKWFLGLKDHNVYLRSTETGEMYFLTDDGTEEYGWDCMGARWSLDGTRIALKKLDFHEMTRVPIVHWLEPLERIETMRWTRPGQPLWKTELYVIDVASLNRVRVDTDREAQPYLSLVGWLPAELIFARVDREYKTLTLQAADPVSGQVRTILTEQQANFHNYEVLGSLPVTPLSDGQHFLWISERDGWSHLYLYSIDGTLIGRLTQGEFLVYQVVKVDEANGWVYFLTAGLDHPYDIQLCRVRFDGGEFACLTDVPGSREVLFSPSGGFFLDVHSDIDRPVRTDLRKADGTLLQTLESADIRDLEKQLHYTTPEEFWVEALDGKTSLRGLLYKPYDFDAARKYPVIEYIYGGPHTFDVPLAFFGFPLLEALAQTGFIVYVVDCPGTIGRGKAFQDVCYQRIGLFELPEHVNVLRQLAEKRSYMDLERVGIFGLSHGGYMTLRAMLTAPEIYRVGVATCPPYGTPDMAWLYVERFNNLPQNNPENYQAGSCLEIAANLQGKLLISHGTIDHNAPIAGTLKMIDALVKAGKPYDLLLMPEQYHLYTGESQRYWEHALMSYFVEHLQAKNEALP